MDTHVDPACHSRMGDRVDRVSATGEKVENSPSSCQKWINRPKVDNSTSSCSVAVSTRVSREAAPVLGARV